jgi:hypothetical protein
MNQNEVIDIPVSRLTEAAYVAHLAICTMRRFIGQSGLSAEGRELLFLLSDAAHNLPLMAVPGNSTYWKEDQINMDIDNCKKLISKINEINMFETEKCKVKSKRFWFFRFFSVKNLNY